MVQSAYAVIGANFGDEGKGLITDYLAAKTGERTLVVRHNGGAQAGHTVVTPEGRRHVFSHFGSGTFVGATTFLSRFFIVNPWLWEKEHFELGQFARLHVDPYASLTIPSDILINQELERQRAAAGTGAHGSCGAGINETVLRCKNGRLATKAGDPIETTRSQLNHIRSNYTIGRVHAALGESGIKPTTVSQWFMDMLYSKTLAESYLESLSHFRKNVAWGIPYSYDGWGAIIFEGAQGLLLDQDHFFQPHVTHSKTGVANACVLFQELCGFHLSIPLEVIYVTRSYMTRHGPGPFPSEVFNFDWMRFKDSTNVPNEFQGTLRFGTLDLQLLRNTVHNDFFTQAGMNPKIKLLGSIAATHLDQMMISGAHFPMPIRYRSYGETRKHVRTDNDKPFIVEPSIVGGGL